ncbi:MAG: nucleotidyl transferase AbiEii/AbiGii toxin family protein [Thermodesulfobacteriota bacterium]|nr:nucleotidyl transferase AbiEii/AbiGii toxin family protein [Thermodesulfobacteriota bacterium]
MNKFLSFSEARRRTVCEQSQNKLGLPPATIEKDFWVCWTLKKLFTLPEWGSRLTFKGGTSLSKGWALIERFSEDIDIVINRGVLGFDGEMAPDRAPSKKQMGKRLKALKEASQKCVNESLLPLLEKAISHEMPSELSWRLHPDPDDPDGQTLLLAYPTAFSDRTSYLEQVVKIELGARSDTEPTQDIYIHPYLEDAFPNLFPQSHITIRTVSPHRTFWEKALLLHEETFRPPEKKRKARMARHYYDLYRLIKAGIGGEAAGDLELFERITAHRQVYFRFTWVDYKTMHPGDLRLVPPEKELALWKSDYTAMKDEMFFGKPPEFEEMIQTVKDFEDEFNDII